MSRAYRTEATMLMPATAVFLALLGPPHVLQPTTPGINQVGLLTAARAHAPALQRKRPDPHLRSPVRGPRKVRAIIIGAALGAVAGATVGYAATANCRCDDPGYGVVLGIPLGALGGGLIGGWMVR